MKNYVFSFDDVFPNNGMSTDPSKIEDYLRNETKNRGVDHIDKRIETFEHEFDILVREIFFIKEKLKNPPGFWENIKLSFKIKKLNELINTNRELRQTLYLERWKRTYG